MRTVSRRSCAFLAGDTRRAPIGFRADVAARRCDYSCGFDVRIRFAASFSIQSAKAGGLEGSSGSEHVDMAAVVTRPSLHLSVVPVPLPLPLPPIIHHHHHLHTTIPPTNTVSHLPPRIADRPNKPNQTADPPPCPRKSVSTSISNGSRRINGETSSVETTKAAAKLFSPNLPLSPPLQRRRPLR